MMPAAAAQRFQLGRVVGHDNAARLAVEHVEVVAGITADDGLLDRDGPLVRDVTNGPPLGGAAGQDVHVRLLRDDDVHLAGLAAQDAANHLGGDVRIVQVVGELEVILVFRFLQFEGGHRGQPLA
jgi:hypothetical protein